jgi:N-carbamoylputrescine amidase
MRNLTVAAIQTYFVDERSENLDRVERLIRGAAIAGARLIVPSELFASTYFCKDELAKHFALAESAEESEVVGRFAALAGELGVVIPISFFERAGQSFFNSVAVADIDGTVLGVYRKSHIPDGPGYEEKYYFSPGDTGFRVFETAVGSVGVGICWDQWFPECARAMVLGGAEILCYPTAIGSEPQDPTFDTRAHWQRVMQGHAAANMVPVVAANRVGREVGEPTVTTFYGSSFIADETGEIVVEADRSEERVLVTAFDLDRVAEARRSYGLFRDRRPDLYGSLMTLDGGRQRP